MESETFEAYIEFDRDFFTLFQDDDVPDDQPATVIGPLQYWEGCQTTFSVLKPEDAEKLTVTFTYDPDFEVSEADSFVFVQDDDGAFIGDALNDVWVNILAPGAYRVHGESDPKDPTHITVRFTPA